DRGIGIPEEHQQKIFDRFYQIDASSRRQYGGMGLGLAIVREILDACHSPIRVESRPGQGSTFSFVLPLATERTGYLPTQGEGRALLIDDDAAFVQPVAAALAARGIHVQTAASVEQGSILVRKLQPDVILLDRLLPDGDGFDLAARLKQDPATRETPLVLCTVRPERRLGLSRGADAYWVKPIPAEEVAERLAALVFEVAGGGEGEGEGRARDSGDRGREPLLGVP
ncbi:MAG: ATP-binding protein, partial [Holophagales bacterium]|nr:ATP-binding protein [Holophagales bacterium]